ncbi:hypothetical protein [Methanobrevibacter sp.]|uniref:hypothetical protein n=1 Tax=Methanobrevibacter sp. TaxID=66852 RepID=UPI0026E0ED0E|nr:hypothetical protein [Methanobrevibacter sp.]MDO5859450.1 hypothetical protein [Methanobrevibacter sp.]
MNFMNDDASIKQFQMIKFINENCDDDHVMSKITVVLRRDKIEAPYYMITKIRMSSCIDRPEKGLIHAMDVFNHTRRHNLTEDTFNEIKSLIIADGYESSLVKISEDDKQLKMVLMSRNDDEIADLFKKYGKLFDKIDNLTD